MDWSEPELLPFCCRSHPISDFRRRCRRWRLRRQQLYYPPLQPSPLPPWQMTIWQLGRFCSYHFLDPRIVVCWLKRILFEAWIYERGLAMARIMLLSLPPKRACKSAKSVSSVDQLVCQLCSYCSFDLGARWRQAVRKHDHFRNGNVFVAAHFSCNHLERFQNTADRHSVNVCTGLLSRAMAAWSGSRSWQIRLNISNVEFQRVTTSFIRRNSKLSGCICCCNDRNFSAATVLRWKCATMAFTFICIAARVATPFFNNQVQSVCKAGKMF